MRQRKKIVINHNTEFELDLAPLLSVMVKLVPVLLLSSSFIQMAIIETELPQVVQEAIKNQDEVKQSVSLFVQNNRNVIIRIHENGKTSELQVPAEAKNQINLKKLNGTLTEVKKQHPDIFKLDLSPENQVTYDELVKVMDESRKSRDHSLQFEVFDKNKNKKVTTDYMFPEVIFANAMEG